MGAINSPFMNRNKPREAITLPLIFLRHYATRPAHKTSLHNLAKMTIFAVLNILII